VNRRELLRNLFEQTYCRLRPSPIHGVGVFAIRDISAGVDPFEGCFRGQSTRLTEAELEGLHPEVRAMVDDYFVARWGGIWACARGLNAVDIQYYLNHSETPNMVARDDGSWFVTARDVSAGEELTVDYATFNDLEIDVTSS
jgi:hypothetical protein